MAFEEALPRILGQLGIPVNIPLFRNLGILFLYFLYQSVIISQYSKKNDAESFIILHITVVLQEIFFTDLG